MQKELERLENRRRFYRTVLSTVSVLIVVAAIAVLAASFLFPVLRIYGTSMAPTLSEGDLILCVRTERAEPGDLIAFYYGNKVLVKRCIATEGDYVEIDGDGNVSVNGTLLDEPYLTKKALGDCDLEMPYQVPSGRYFVLGDRRESSADSRNSMIGCISSEQLIGKIRFRIWPLSEFGTVEKTIRSV